MRAWKSASSQVESIEAFNARAGLSVESGDRAQSRCSRTLQRTKRSTESVTRAKPYLFPARQEAPVVQRGPVVQSRTLGQSAMLRKCVNKSCVNQRLCQKWVSCSDLGFPHEALSFRTLRAAGVMDIERDLAAGNRSVGVAVYSFEAPRVIAQPDPHIGCHFKRSDN